MSLARRERQREREQQAIKELMAKVDLLWSSPSERAEDVWGTLQSGCAAERRPLPSQWDLLCFNAEALGKVAIGIGNPDLLELTQQVLRWVYQVHYNHPQDVMGDPDKRAASPAAESEENAVQSEQSDDRQESSLSSGHARGSEDTSVAEREPEETRIQDS